MNHISKAAVVLMSAVTLVGCQSANRTAFDPTTDNARAIYNSKSIYFDLGSASIKKDQDKMIRAHVDYMERNSAVMLTLQGSADTVNSDPKDIKLANLRAEAVRSALVALGADAKRITVMGAVDADPKRTGRDPAKSRRVDFIYR